MVIYDMILFAIALIKKLEKKQISNKNWDSLKIAKGLL